MWARISVVFAGPFFNFIMAFIFALIIICSVGYDSPKLAGVIEGYAAEEAGIKAGDEIVKLNNTNIHFYREISLYSMLHEGETVDVTYLRDGKRHTTTLKPKYDETTRGICTALTCRESVQSPAWERHCFIAATR